MGPGLRRGAFFFWRLIWVHHFPVRGIGLDQVAPAPAWIAVTAAAGGLDRDPVTGMEHGGDL